jgi:hypothetical protein
MGDGGLRGGSSAARAPVGMTGRGLAGARRATLDWLRRTPLRSQ